MPGPQRIPRSFNTSIVLVPDLTSGEVQDLSDLLDGTEAMSTESDLDRQQNYRLWNESVEFGRHHSHVRFPYIGAVGKSALDVVVDKVKKWLATRPDDRMVRIYGGDGQVVLVAKRGKVIETGRDLFLTIQDTDVCSTIWISPGGWWEQIS